MDPVDSSPQVGQSKRTRTRRLLVAVAAVALALSSPVWLMYGFNLVTEAVPTSRVKVVNASGQRLLEGDYSAFGRHYKFGPIKSGGTESFAIFAPQEHGVSRVHVRLASGAVLDGEGFLYAPWFSTQTFEVSAIEVEEVLPAAE